MYIAMELIFIFMFASSYIAVVKSCITLPIINYQFRDYTNWTFCGYIFLCYDHSVVCKHSDKEQLSLDISTNILIRSVPFLGITTIGAHQWVGLVTGAIMPCCCSNSNIHNYNQSYTHNYVLHS